MSYQAIDWVDNLEHDRIGYLPYRVLLKLANVADVHGQRAFRSKAHLSDELGVSQRSIQDAMKQLQQARLIKRGDQRHVAHLPANRRPVVYDLVLPKRTTELFDLDEPDVQTPIQGRSSYPQSDGSGEKPLSTPDRSGEKHARFRTPYRRTDISTTHSDPTRGAREAPATCAEGHPLTLVLDHLGLWIVACKDGHLAAETVTA